MSSLATPSGNTGFTSRTDLMTSKPSVGVGESSNRSCHRRVHYTASSSSNAQSNTSMWTFWMLLSILVLMSAPLSVLSVPLHHPLTTSSEDRSRLEPSKLYRSLQRQGTMFLPRSMNPKENADDETTGPDAVENMMILAPEFIPGQQSVVSKHQLILQWYQYHIN